MKVWGKLIGGVLGYILSESVFGLVIGLFLGHQLDRKLQAGSIAGVGGGSRKQTEIAFFATTFSVMGHISKSDGHVSPEEIQVAEQVMRQMRLSKEQRISAIGYFNQGKQDNFDLDDALHAFRQECARKPALIQMFIEIQLQAAYADGVKDFDEQQVLLKICTALGYPQALLAQLESMLFASQRSRQTYDENSTYVRSNTALEDAYQIIGVSEAATDAELKKAYRRLMSQNHPDKLISKGLPKEMIDIATNKTQEIQKAYDLISKNRK